jgi:hypothetical protein
MQCRTLVTRHALIFGMFSQITPNEIGMSETLRSLQADRRERVGRWVQNPMSDEI